ncbi:MAG: isoleucine--tRNA ligase [Candidatus Hodarchaeales archaeon]|jgi:isoleucyl-tRNA synthetase
MKFPKLTTKPDLPERETNVMEYWKKISLEKKVQEASKEKSLFVFLEGPPTANGLPHVGHALTRCIKDVYLRYKTMTGHFVSPRIGGWDCHGLPVEIEVEKHLGLNDKEDIVAYGVDRFIKECQISVMRYVNEWEYMSDRIGFQLDLPRSYITMSEDYIESVWWSLKQIYDKKLLFKGYKVIPYCTRCGTPISSHEVAQGYQETTDPSIYIKFQIKGEDNRYFLAWTTTPWTLLSNLVLAINESEKYIEVEHEDETLIFAKDLLPKVFPSKKKILKEFLGKDLLDMDYEALFPFTAEKKTGRAHFVVAADFVSMEDGTGIVHCAPAFGVEDYELCQEIGVDMFNPVLDNGKFVDDMPDFGGMHVKEADPLIMDKLKEENKLLRVEEITHTYPFCWRCDSPLLYYAIESWFIGMSQVRERIQELNQGIRWVPKHLKDGRFGNFLDELKDWSLSRSRYWGTPLPIWRCEKNHEFIIGSRKELEQSIKGKLPKGFSLHKPDVDSIEVFCSTCNSKATREPYVIDAWYDSGSAFFAQWHYPFENKEEFERHFPINFITEAIDQTRGWFYSLLAISTVIFDQAAYETCLTMGHVRNAEGTKMSKSRGTVIDPEDAFSRFGADPVRWLYFNAPTWNDARFGFHLVEEGMKEFILPMWNVLSFFITYANLDEYSPKLSKYNVPYAKRPLLDKWVLSRYNNMLMEVHKAYRDLSIHHATKALQNFVTNDLSNLWIRQSRRRFWEKSLTISKKSAYSTLYEILESMSRAVAPVLPFFAEEMHRILVRSQQKGGESVHLEEFPQPNNKMIKPDLEKQLTVSREVITNGRAIRAKKDLKVRWPLQQVIIVTNDGGKKAIKAFKNIILQELNVKDLEFSDDPLAFQDIVLSPNFKQLGPKFKKNANKVASWMKTQKGMEAKNIAANLNEKGKVSVDIDGESTIIDLNDLEIRITEKEGFSGSSFAEGDLFLNLALTEELIQEGFIRDLIRRIQSMRKDLELVYDAEIDVYFTNMNKKTKDRIIAYSNLIQEEVLASELKFSAVKEGFKKEWTIQDPEGSAISININVVS